MHTQDTITLDELYKLSHITEESYLIKHSVDQGLLSILLKKDAEFMSFSILANTFFLDTIDASKVNCGTLCFEKLSNLLMVDDNGYFMMNNEDNQHHKSFRRKSNLAIGCHINDYSYLGFFKGSTIRNAFLIGRKNLESIRIKKL